MISSLKRLIDRTTMYRLVLYYLLVLLGAAAVFGALGVLPYGTLNILASASILVASSWIANGLIARYFGVPTSHESSIITALIIALIIPPVSLGDTPGLLALGVIAIWAMASKYLIGWGNKHVFNPAAFAVALAAFALGMPGTWWVAGSLALLPFVFGGGIFVVGKLRRWDLALSFFASALIAIAATSLDPVASLQATVLHSAFFFLAFAMLTEPLTMPPSRALRIWYGAIVGILFAPAAHIGSFYFSPELALLAGNAYSFAVSPKGRYALSLVGRTKIANGIYEFAFQSARSPAFSAGQYLEWTLPSVAFDSRGNRRYFTIASAPEDGTVALGVRFYDAPSAFKRALAKLRPGDVVQAGGLAGDFVLPKNRDTKLAFLAGGIGVTPFASMARHLSASGERRDAVLLYAARTAEDMAYRDVFSGAAANGLRTIYTPTNERGLVDSAFIAHAIPDYRERVFYVSGPPGMVDAMRRALRNLGVSRFSIKTDYFPGLA